MFCRADSRRSTETTVLGAVPRVPSSGKWQLLVIYREKKQFRRAFLLLSAQRVFTSVKGIDLYAIHIIANPSIAVLAVVCQSISKRYSSDDRAASSHPMFFYQSICSIHTDFSAGILIQIWFRLNATFLGICPIHIQFQRKSSSAV